MDPGLNPYQPGAGTSPDVLAGRDEELRHFDLLVRRLSNGMSEKSLLISGLRGVGKTVLLNRFRDTAREAGWAVVSIECDVDTSLPDAIGCEFHEIIAALEPTKAALGKLTSVVNRLGTFTLTDPNGFALEFKFGRAEAPQQKLQSDLVHLFLEIGQIAKRKNGGIIFLLDEVQYLDPAEFRPFVMALHRIAQEGLPVASVIAGLPSIDEVTSKARTYTERLFEVADLGRLEISLANTAFVEPSRARGVECTKEACEMVFAATDGYPYFIQEYGKHAWNVARDNVITGEDIAEAELYVLRALDKSFFRLRLRRTTKAERQYLRAMCEAGTAPYKVNEIAHVLGKKSSSLTSKEREHLIQKGLLYSQHYGTLEFTVPMFDDYLRRRYPSLQDVALEASTA